MRAVILESRQNIGGNAMTEKRKERCETCRFWDCYAESEPKFVTRREWREALGLSNENTGWTPEQLEEMCVNDDRRGDCKRKSPCVFGREDHSRQAVWPVVTYCDWCGEWKPKAAAPLVDVDALQLLGKMRADADFPSHTVEVLKPKVVEKEDGTYDVTYRFLLRPANSDQCGNPQPNVSTTRPAKVVTLAFNEEVEFHLPQLGRRFNGFIQSISKCDEDRYEVIIRVSGELS